MPLSRSDLDAIRNIVREELALAAEHREHVSAPAISAIDGEDDDDQHRAIAEMARAMIAMLRGDPGGKERELQAEAYYRAKYDESWIRRAMEARRVPSDAPVTVEEMKVSRRFDISSASGDRCCP